MTNTKYNRHLFQILEPSLWPFFLASGLFFFVTGLAFSMHYIIKGYYIILLGIIILIFTAIFWFLDISREAVIDGYHTRIVRSNLKFGFLFFIVSEIMLFFGFFWAFFHSALSPSIELGSLWPPNGLNAIAVFDFPLYNTFILIISGFSVTLAHRAISLGSFKNAVDGLIITIFLGLFFIILQGLEYYESTFNLQDGVYTCIFFIDWTTWLSCNCRCCFFIFLFYIFIISSFFRWSLFKICICCLILTFCWYCMNFIIFNIVLLR